MCCRAIKTTIIGVALIASQSLLSEEALILILDFQESDVQRRSRNPSFSKSGNAQTSRHSSGSGSSGASRGRARTVSEGDSWTSVTGASSPRHHHQPYAGRHSAGDSSQRKRTTSSSSGQTTFVTASTTSTTTTATSGQNKNLPLQPQQLKNKMEELSAKVCRAKNKQTSVIYFVSCFSSLA